MSDTWRDYDAAGEARKALHEGRIDPNLARFIVNAARSRPMSDEMRGVRRAIIADALWKNRYRLQRFTDDNDFPMFENVAREIADALRVVE